MENKKVPYVHEDSIHNTKAAKAFLPYLFEVIRPNSVLDIGCGTGTWLRVLSEAGVQVILGVDGDYVDIKKLHINPNYFIGLDLSKEINLNKKFDLVISLEVAEHLPQSSADAFVLTLINHSDVILFSAALTNQGGQNHLNEQPFSYWVNKFEENGYVFLDVFRNKIWDDPNIDCWYRQNIFLIVKKDNILLETCHATKIHDFYHPEIYQMVWEDRRNFVNKFRVASDNFDSLISGRYGILQSFKIFVKSLLYLVR